MTRSVLSQRVIDADRAAWREIMWAARQSQRDEDEYKTFVHKVCVTGIAIGVVINVAKFLSL